MHNDHDRLDRRIRAAVEEYNELKRRRFTIVRLSEPVQRGWLRVFVMTEYALRRRDAETLSAILSVINTERRSRRPDFLTRQCRTRRLIEIEQSVRTIGDREWSNRKLSAAWFPYFRIYHYSEWGRPAFRAEFAYPSLFELQVQPHWIWNALDLNPAIESRLSELDRWLHHQCRLQRWGWLNGHQQRYRWAEQDTARNRSLLREHRRDIRNAMRGEVDSIASARCDRISLIHSRNNFPGVAQWRGIGLRSRKVQVRFLPSGPISNSKPCVVHREKQTGSP